MSLAFVPMFSEPRSRKFKRMLRTRWVMQERSLRRLCEAKLRVEAAKRSEHQLTKFARSVDEILRLDSRLLLRFFAFAK